MEKLFREAEPYLRRNGSLNIRHEDCHRDFTEIANMLGELDLDSRVYFRGVFTKRLSEKLTHFRILPKHLHTNWALSKFADWLTVGMKDDPVAMEIEYANKSKPANDRDYFTTDAGLIPKCLEDIRHRQVSLCWCVVNKQFWKMMETLPQDIKDEYFYPYDIFYVSKMTRMNRRFVNGITRSTGCSAKNPK